MSSLALKPCLDNVTLSPAGGALCLMPPLFDPDPAVNPAPNAITTVGPISPTNFPDEVFYWVADAAADVTVTGGVGGAPARLRLRMALEGNAANAFTPPLAASLTFMRINLAQMDGLAPNGSYTVSTPYGDINVTADAAGVVKDANFNNQAFRNQIDATPPLFDAILPAIFPAIPPQQPLAITMDQLLVWDPAVLPTAPAGFIGDPNVPHRVVKSGDVVQAVVTFSGTGIAAPVTITDFSVAGQIIGLQLIPPASTDFGTVKPGTPPPAAKRFVLTNLTALPVDPVIAAIVPGTPGTASPDFTIVPSAVNPCAPGLASGANCNFDVVFNPVAGADGLRSATISATAGPTVPAASATVTGTADASGPIVAITTPANGSFTKVNTPLLTFSATDPTTPVTNVVRVDTAVVATLSGENLALLADGPHTIQVQSTDAVGNVSTVSSNFTVDTLVPAVAVTAPANNGLTPATTPLSFSATDLNLASTVFKLDGAIVTPVPTTLTGLGDGLHSVSIEATDAAGNLTTVTNGFTADGTAPSVAITSPKLTVASATANAIGVSNPVLSFTETDAHPNPATPPVVKLDGVVIPVQNGVTTLGSFLTPGVERVLTIEATDLLGNTSTKTMPINLVLADGAMTTLGNEPVSIGDVLRALDISAELATLDPTTDEFKHGDVAPMVNGVSQPDQKIGIDDVMFILRKVAGLITF